MGCSLPAGIAFGWGNRAVPDDRGVTHISDLQDAIAERQPERLAYFAFDLLYLDGHDLERAAPARFPGRVSARLVYVDHVTGRGAELFEHVQAVGAEGIVSNVDTVVTGTERR
jgi:bifunctional non-homologous end joining protein LigD